MTELQLTSPELKRLFDVIDFATIIRTFGHATTEIWGAIEWDKFTDLVRYPAPASMAS